MWQVRKLKEDLVGSIVGLLLSFLIITYALSFKDILIEHESPKETIKVTIGENFMYCRTVEYTEDAFITIDKTIVKHASSGELITLHYPRHKLFRHATDKKKICKVMQLPKGVTEGEWVIETFASYIVFPFWSKTIKLNDIFLDVKEKN